MKLLSLLPLFAIFTAFGCASPTEDGEEANDLAYTAGQAPGTPETRDAAEKLAVFKAKAKLAKTLFDGFNKGSDPTKLSEWTKALKYNCGVKTLDGVPFKVWTPDDATANVLRAAHYSSDQVFYVEVPAGKNKLDIKFVALDLSNMQDNVCSSDTHVVALTCINVPVGAKLSAAACGLSR